MIESEMNALLTYSQAAREVRNPGVRRGVAVQVIVRWAHKGCRGVRLWSTRIRGVWYTRRTALREFLAATRMVYRLKPRAWRRVPMGRRAVASWAQISRSALVIAPRQSCPT